MSTNIKITYINKSDYQFDSTILVYMHPPILPNAAYSTAWQVIKNIGHNCWHKFTYSVDTSLLIIWERNGQTEILSKNIALGTTYSFEKNSQGFSLVDSGYSDDTNQLDIINNTNLPGEITVIALNNNQPIQTKRINSNEKTQFLFNPKLYFGICSQYEVGNIIRLPVKSEVSTEISLQYASNLKVFLKGNKVNGYRFLISYN